MSLQTTVAPGGDMEADRPETAAKSVPPAAPGLAGRIAYFTNCYPKISHTFIRNEINALERLGFDIVRVTIRPSAEGLVDARDVAEVDRTVVLLDGGGARLALAVATRIVRHPGLTLTTLARTLWRRPAGLLRSMAYFAEACALAALAQTQRVRHVHVHFGTNPAAIALIARRLGGPTFSMTVHGPDEFDAPAALDLRGKIAGAAFVAAVSSFGRSQLMRWSAPGDWPNIHVVRCGVAPDFHVSPAVEDVGLRSATLVCVARLSGQKGLPLLLEAAERLAQTERFSLRIIGDGELRLTIEAAILARGLRRHVRLVGWMGTEDVRRELLDARALVLPSFAEGLPVVLMEALALGRPVVATAIAGIPELVDARNGWLVPAGSATALTEALRAALHADADTLRAMGKVGLRRVRRDHDVDRNGAQLAALLTAAIAGPVNQPRRRS